MIIRVLLPILFLILPCSAIAAGTGSSPLETNKWALQFGIERELDVTAFESGAISFKRQMTPQSALRFGFALRYSDDWDNDDYFSNALSMLYQRYVTPERAAKFYWALGPVFRFGYSNSTSHYGSDSYSKAKVKNFSTGLLGSIGVEWFANDVISFHSEYRSGAQYYWRKGDYETKPEGEEPQTSSSKVDKFSIQFESSLLFGMSIYF